MTTTRWVTLAADRLGLAAAAGQPLQLVVPGLDPLDDHGLAAAAAGANAPGHRSDPEVAAPDHEGSRVPSARATMPRRPWAATTSAAACAFARIRRACRTGFIRSAASVEERRAWIRQAADRLIWIDLEMTGLDPQRHRIIEIATVVTDKAHLSSRRRAMLAIHQDDAVLAAWTSGTPTESPA